MKKVLIPLSIITMILFSFSSCKKDKVERTVVGYWKGKYLGNPSTDWSWVIRSNNTLRVYIGLDTGTASKYEGTYTSTDSTISIKYPLIQGINVVLNNAKLNNEFTRIDGEDMFGYQYYLDKQ